MICEHCGSTGHHTAEDCTVKDTTDRILAPREFAPEGGLVINGSYAGRADGNGNWVGGHLYADEDGTVRWAPA